MHHRVFYFMADDANVIGFFLSYRDHINICVKEFLMVGHVNVHFTEFFLFYGKWYFVGFYCPMA